VWFLVVFIACYTSYVVHNVDTQRYCKLVLDRTCFLRLTSAARSSSVAFLLALLSWMDAHTLILPLTKPSTARYDTSPSHTPSQSFPPPRSDPRCRHGHTHEPLLPNSLSKQRNHAHQHPRPACPRRWPWFPHCRGLSSACICHPCHHLHLTDCLQAQKTTVKGLQDMMLDPEGFVHVAEDGIARSYARKSSLLH
jgi:hypothetical protein